MKCIKCGAMLPDTVKFCIMCGNKMEPAGQAPMQPQQQPISQPQPQRQGSTEANGRSISEKHYSLEDIARQQEMNKNEIGLASPQRRQPAGNQNRTSSSGSGKTAQTSQDDSAPLVYSVKTPAVPLGKQKQIYTSVFDENIADVLESLKNN